MTNNSRRKNKRTLNKKKIIVFSLLLLIIVIFIFFMIGAYKKIKDRENNKVVNEIESYGYSASNRDTKLFKDTFKELKDELSKEKIDNKNYASLIGKLFIIDFYTLNNKTNVNDVGSTQFVYSDFKSDFIDIARTGMYKQIESNIDNNRNQDLPEVRSITIESIDEVVPSAFIDNDEFSNIKDAEAYEIKLKWTYTNENNFQDSASILVVKDNGKLSVAKLY